MKLNSLTLNNFRCFQNASFDLSADVIAIYGRNGVGKTAIFDAIEFALLGSVGRYNRKMSVPDFIPCRFGGKDVSVRLNFSGQSNHWVGVDRTTDEAKPWRLSGSGDWHTNSDLLYDFLLDPELTPERKQSDQAAEYIRSTLLLSQHSIREFVEADAPDRKTILAFLAGAGAVQRRLDKAKAVLEEAERESRKERDQSIEAVQNLNQLLPICSENEGRIQSLREQLLGKTVTHGSLITALQQAGVAINVSELESLKGELFASHVRGICAEHIYFFENQLNLLTEIATMSEVHSDARKQNLKLVEDIKLAKSKHSELIAGENESTTKLQNLEREIGGIGQQLAELSANLKDWERMQELRILLNEQSKSLLDYEDTEKLMRNELTTLKTSINALISDLKEMLPNDISAELRGEQLFSELKALQFLKREVSGYESYLSVAITQTVRSISLENTLSELMLNKTAYDITLLQTETKVSTLNRFVAEARSATEDIASLATRLREYVKGPECPLCGHVHESLNDLQTSIGNRLSHIPETLKNASRELEDALKAKATLSAIVADNKSRLMNLQHSLKDATEQRMNAISIITSAVEHKSQATESARRAFLTTQSRINSWQSDDSYLMSDQDLNGKISAGQTRIELMVSSRAEKTGSRDGLRNQLASLQNERRTLEESLSRLEGLYSHTSAQIESFRIKCGQLGLSEESGNDKIANCRAQVSGQITDFQTIVRLADSYSSTVKIAEIEEMQGINLAKKNDAERLVETVRQKITALESAKQDINEWIKLLSEQVNRAVTDRIQAHKHEINNFFKAMIPAPYLFENVTMSQLGDGLKLGLRFRGQEEDAGEPLFFLSNAQSNVLALSLFLSFTRAQRWAKLETILLDDPVQHLDDLDAVAFLDTLRSVALGGLGPRKQVIISTCDQNLYLLMIRKFGMLESMGLRFTGISLLDRGEAGPEILYDIGGLSGKSFLREAV